MNVIVAKAAALVSLKPEFKDYQSKLSKAKALEEGL